MPPNPSSKKLQKYGALPDVEAEEGTEGTTDSSSYESSPLLYDVTTTTKPTKEKSTYDLTFAFQLMSGFVWASMSIWGVWISVYYSIAALTDWNKFNIVFPDLYTPDRPLASFAICFHLVGAAFMAMAGAFQLVKYIRKEHPVFHRWVGRLYIVSSLIASIGALIFIFTKGDYGGKPADYAFGTYGIIFLTSGTMTYYYAYRREFLWHKLWAWRLYSLSLAAWMYRFDYYWWELLFGKGEDSWLHSENFQAGFDIWINWMFYVPNLIVVEIIFRWGENATLGSSWVRVLDVLYYVALGMAVIFTLHAFIQLWLPSIMGWYTHGWIM